MIEVRKRVKGTEMYDKNKVLNAVLKAMKQTDVVDEVKAQEVADMVSLMVSYKAKENEEQISVDDIHNLVENEMMNRGLNEAAKEYILYRDKHRANIFSKRTNLRPYEYPELVEYVDAIRHSYWVHTEFNYTSDVQDFMVGLSEVERSAVTRAMLAISQIEIAVKTFWGDIYKRIPKPEVGNVGATFAESEVRHADAYSNLIKILGLSEEFEKLLDVPVIRRRIKFLEKSIANANSSEIENKDYFENIILFSIFVENVSLFSQFLVIMSFNKFKNMLKGMSNAVEATSKEENIHAEFGFDLINTIKKENPHWWTEDLVEDIVDATIDAYDVESDIIDWIFEKGDLDFLTKEQTRHFIKKRYNDSLKKIGIEPIFKEYPYELKATEWFNDEIFTTKHTDFFNKRSINYSKRQKSITEDDLF